MEIREVIHGSPEYARTVELRLEVLRRPLGLDFTPESLSEESAEFHLAAFESETVLACLVLVPLDEGRIKMRQVAVLPHLQGTGIGSRLVTASEAFALQNGFRVMTLHARETAVNFYQRLDYQCVGEPFDEVSIPHVEMVKAMGPTG